jgi:acetoin utilization deacetylase AcuC-like enzyme
MYAMERIVVPAIKGYKPDLIVVASGYDANDFDPLGRMMLHSESYRELTKTVMALADTYCKGRVVVVHEGGYAEAVVPFCGHALVETLCGEKMGVDDPFLDFAVAQQPFEHFRKFQRQLIDDMAAKLK